MDSQRSSANHPRVGLGETVWPTGRRGWVGVVAAAIGLGSWIVLPLVTSIFADRYPVTDTVVMTVIGLVLTVGAALFFGFFIVGEGLGGA